jgi:hypothetical protein
MLQQQGIGFGTPQGAIGVAHHVCDTLGGGMEPSDISSNIARCAVHQHALSGQGGSTL